MALALIKEPMPPTHAGESKQLYCPTCGGELRYDSSGNSLSCVNEDACNFALSFTESGRGSILWDIRCEALKTDPARFSQLVMDVAARLDIGLPLAVNNPNPYIVKHRSPAEKLARLYLIEPEDVFSIRHSSERISELALYYGISVRDIKEIKNADIEEE